MHADGLTEDLFELSADVVVVGSGAAATAAAATAAHEGLEVVVLEAGEIYGGTTALSGAGAWVPNNRFMREAGIDDPREPALRYMASLAYPDLYDPTSPTLGLPPLQYDLVATYYDRCSEAVDFFIDIGATDFIADIDLPDYFGLHPDNEAPRGRKIHPPERRHGHADAGPAHINRMLDYVRAHGGSTHLNHRVMGLLENAEGEIVGVEVHAGVRSILVRARRSVVFGTGGFIHDADLRREFLAGPTYGSCAVAEARGDIIRIAGEVGASMGNMAHAWWYQVVLDHAVESSHVAGGLFMPFGDAMIQVNRFGRRVVNEKAPYNERGQIHFLWDGREYPNLVLFEIFDDDVRTSPDPTPHRYPIPQPDENVNYLISGDTLDELAQRIAERLEHFAPHTGGVELAADFVDNLTATIERYNGFAAAGVDADFGRGEELISVHWSGDPRPGAKATMHPLRSEGPYHCMLLVAGALDTKGGPRINTNAQILDTADEPIPGLYGAGNCIAGPAGRSYWGPGATIGAGFTFGYIAGLQAAHEPDKKL